MAKLPVNQVEIVGRCNRIDARFGESKDGREFVSMTFTLDVEGNQIRVESFSMRYKKNSEDELGSYKGLMTLLNESNALHKTSKKMKEDNTEELEEGIVENIEECSAIKFNNYGAFKSCKFVENSYAKDGSIVKNIRIEGSYPSRLDESKTTYAPKADFEICGIVKTPPILLEDVDGNEFMQFNVMVPNYVDAYGERKASVTLNEVVVQSHDTSVFGYLEDNFEVNSFVYLNGELVRKVERIEVEAPMDDESRGFGRVVKHQANYQTKTTEYMEILGGYVLEQDEIEEEPAFDMELWEEAMKVKKEKEEQMLNGGNEEKPKQGFGRGGSEVKKPKLPF